jgi:putative heme iron utilization protein
MTVFDKVEAMRKQSNDRTEENRIRMPTITRLIDSFRAEFPEVRVTYASENGIVKGSKSPDGVKMSETLIGAWNKK